MLPWAIALSVLVLPLDQTRATAQIPAEEYAARRTALADRFDRGVVVAFGGPQPVRHWPPFYQLPAFRYLTGFTESNAAFVMVKDDAGRLTSSLFLARPDDHGVA